MPTIKELSNGFRFFFFSFDCNEPLHVHVSKESKICKFRVEALSLAKTTAFRQKSLMPFKG